MGFKLSAAGGSFVILSSHHVDVGSVADFSVAHAAVLHMHAV
jgi:hypothetical protein